MKLSGEARLIADALFMNSAQRGGAFSVSATGALVYQTVDSVGGDRLMWATRTGPSQRTTIVDEPHYYGDLSLSPGGAQAAVSVDNLRGRKDIWILTLRSGLLAPFRSNAGAKAVWSQDGRAVVFSVSNADGTSTLFYKQADGSGTEKQVVSDRRPMAPTSVSAAGVLLYEVLTPQGYDIWTVPLDRSSEPTPVVATRAAERRGQFSPDGRWIAYSSNPDARREVYITRNGGSGGSIQVSIAGGDFPRWSRDWSRGGGELFFYSPDYKLNVARIVAGADAVDVTSRTALFDVQSLAGGQRYFYDVAADGRFLLMTPSYSTATMVSLITDWPSVVRR